MSKWTEKDVMEHARKLKSPFEKTQTNNKPKLSEVLVGMAGKIRGKPRETR